MGLCFNSGGWHFSQIIDVENPSKDLDIYKNTTGSPMSKSCVLLKFVYCSTWFIVELLNNVSVRMLLLISNTRHFPNILPNL